MFLKLLKFVWLFESMTSEDLDYNAQVIWCFLAFIAQEQREHPSKRLLLCSRREKVTWVWKDSKWWQNLDLCVFVADESSTPHMPSGLWHTSTAASFFSFSPSKLKHTASTQCHSPGERRQLWDTFDAWFTTVFQSEAWDRVHIQKQRKQHHKTPHAWRPICKTDTRDGLSALVECFTHNALVW